MRRMRMALVVGGVLGGIVGCTKPLPNHCANNLGDLSCAAKGLGAYCSLCVLEADGCIDEVPSEDCYWPGLAVQATTGGEDGSGGLSSGSGVDDGSETTVGTSTSGEVVDGSETTAGECGSCPTNTPVCVDGDCVECTVEDLGACDAGTQICDEISNTCLTTMCDSHDDCGEAGCNFYEGICLPADAVVHVGPGAEYTSITAAVEAFRPGQEGTVVVHQGIYADPVIADGDRVLAILAHDGDLPVWNHFAGIPQLSVNDATVILDGFEISGNGSSEPALQLSGALTRVWVDRSRIVNNAGGGILAQFASALTLRNCFVGGDDSGAHALEVSDAAATISYSTLIAGSFGSWTLLCTPISFVEVSDSIILRYGDVVDPVDCGSAVFDHSASEMSLPGGSNVDVGFFDVGNGWFADAANGDFTLTPWGADTFMGIAQWNVGDPLTDIEGDPRNNSDGDPDYAGADQP